MDARFYGIYRGVCIDNDDPDKLNRITLQVPQLLGTQVTTWALPCTPVTDNANHLDHKNHTAAQVAALLTTTAVGITDSRGDTSTVPALTVVAKNSNYLDHAHKTSTDPLDKDGSEDGLTAAEHTYHRAVPNVGQQVWVMFVAGDPNFPVWMGV